MSKSRIIPLIEKSLSNNDVINIHIFYYFYNNLLILYHFIYCLQNKDKSNRLIK